MDRQMLIATACGLAACLPFLAVATSLALLRRRRDLARLLTPFALAAATGATALFVLG